MSSHSNGPHPSLPIRFRDHAVDIVKVFGAMALVLAVIGFWPPEGLTKQTAFLVVTKEIYEVMEMLNLHSPPEEVGRNLCLQWCVLFLAASYGIVLCLLAKRFLAHSHLRKATKSPGKYVVVCGLGPVGLQIVTDYVSGNTGNEKARVVAIEKDESSPGVETARGLGAVVVAGDASQHSILKKACAHQARRVFAVTGSDVANFGIAADLALDREGGPARRVDCHVHLTDPALAELFRMAPAFTDTGSRANVRGFNCYQRAANQLIFDMHKDSLPAEGEVTHFFLFGFGTMGQTVARELAMQAHFANLKRFRLTVFDPAAESAANAFLSSYPAFCPERGSVDLANLPVGIDRWDHFDPKIRPVPDARGEGHGTGPGIEYVCNAEFRTLPVDAGGPFLSHIVVPRIEQKAVIPRFIICFEDEQQSFATAVNLRNVLKAYREAGTLQIFVAFKRRSAVERLLLTGDEGPVQIIGFGNPADICGWNHIVHDQYEKLAEFMHGKYVDARLREDPRAAGPAMKQWGELPEEYRASNLQRAYHMEIKLRVLGPERINEGMQEAVAEMEHNRWCSEKLMSGWRYGAVRNEPLKIHDYLVPYANLPEHVKEYDRKAAPELFEFLKEGQRFVKRGGAAAE